ncbi:hypothetical protein D3C77_472250 [compost metagenome]
MALQHRPQRFQALSIITCQGVVHPVQAPVDTLEGRVLVRRRPIALQEAVDTGVQHHRIAPHIPAHGLGRGDLHFAIDTQLGHDPGPTLSDRLLDNRQMKDPGLDHFQDIFHRQRRIDPFHLDRRQLA